MTSSKWSGRKGARMRYAVEEQTRRRPHPPHGLMHCYLYALCALVMTLFPMTNLSIVVVELMGRMDVKWTPGGWNNKK